MMFFALTAAFSGVAVAYEPLSHHVLGMQGDCGPNIDFDSWLSASPPAADFDLVQAHTFVRHGARTNWERRRCWNKPYSDYKQHCVQGTAGMPFSGSESTNGFHFVVKPINASEYFPGNCMTGQLIEEGFDMEFTNGFGLHQRYAADTANSYKVLPTALNSDTIDTLGDVLYMRADDSHRVQQSLMGVFTGMYPESQKESVAKGLTLPLWTMDRFYEIIFPNGKVCPQWDANWEGAIRSQQWQAQGVAMQPLLSKLTPVFYNEGEMHWEDVEHMYDCVNVRICEKWPLPPEIDQSVFDALSGNYSWMFNLVNEYPNWQSATRFQVGPLLRFVKERLEDRLSGSDARKVYLYAGHDTGPITPLLGFFKFVSDHWPTYAAMISIELFREKTTGRLYVLTSYNGKIIQLPPPCDAQQYGLCSFEAFSKYWADVIPDASECVKLE